MGDNLIYNADLLCKLTEANETGIYNKMVVVQLGSIVEAALAQIIYRAQNYNKEGVPRISELEQAEIADKTIDKFNTIIDILKKYGVLDPLGADVYDELHKLRRYRNKVHIQDYIKDAPRDEGAAFSEDNCIWAFRLALRVLKYLSEHLSRPEELHRYMGVLSIPIK